LFKYGDFNIARGVYLALGGALCLVGILALRKIYNYHERNWLGLILYSYVGFWSFRKAY
jgi:hypothetical protein